MQKHIPSLCTNNLYLFLSNDVSPEYEQTWKTSFVNVNNNKTFWLRLTWNSGTKCCEGKFRCDRYETFTYFTRNRFKRNDISSNVALERQLHWLTSRPPYRKSPFGDHWIKLSFNLVKIVGFIPPVHLALVSRFMVTSAQLFERPFRAFSVENQP